jgi:hypothetical protein
VLVFVARLVAASIEDWSGMLLGRVIGYIMAGVVVFPFAIWVSAKLKKWRSYD